MSLIVLNSKGEDPEDFTNYVTEQIEFPKNAEVCLVHSHINRRLLVEDEMVIDAGTNSLGFQLGLGDTTTDRNADGYTAHSPCNLLFSDNTKQFPIYYPTFPSMIAGVDSVLNDHHRQLISPLVQGWTTAIPAAPAAAQLTLFCTMKVPTDAESLGQSAIENFVIQPGHQGGNGDGGAAAETGINNPYTTAEFAAPIVPAAPLVGYANWVELETTGLVDEACGYVDVDPLFNTDTGGRFGVFTLEATNINLAGGGWNWQLDARAVTARLQMMRMTGGVVTGAQNIINTGTEGGNVPDNMTGGNPDHNVITGGTDFCLWWKIIQFDVATGSGEVGFFCRNITPGVKREQDQDGFQWGRARWLPTIESVRIGMRPIQGTAAAVGKYVIEGYVMNVTTATNVPIGGAAAVISAVSPGYLGYVEVTDPLNTTVIASGQGSFDLYRHLPLRQAINMPLVATMRMNATHHGYATDDMAPATQGSTKPFSFGFNSVRQQDLGGYDTYFSQVIQKSNIGTVLGFNQYVQTQTATLMLPASTGVIAPIAVDLCIPMNHSLVVTLPDLPISGFYGNSLGDISTGTLNINSGGTSAAILGVIPYGSAPLRWYDAADGLDAARGEYYSSPMENWIKLKNPTSFSLSSLRVKLTDELGQKPRCLSNNTTITIKIKAPNGGADARLEVQG